MSEAREWADRSWETRPNLELLATDCRAEPSLWAGVTVNADCEVTIKQGRVVGSIIIPHDLAVALGTFLVRTFSETTELLHGRPHDAKMTEDHG